MTRFTKSLFACFVMAMVFANSPCTIEAQELTTKQNRQLKMIDSTLDKAMRLTQSKKHKSSADKANLAHKQILQLATSANARLMKQLQRRHNRLGKIHKLLDKHNVTLEALSPLPEPVSDNAKNVSFVSDVAPILVKNCGRCHVNGTRGQFSAKDYNSLMNSLHVSAGLPDRSRLIEVVTDGSMPPNGQVAKQELDVLKNWIRQGARFDGENPAANLNQLAGVNNAASERPRLRPTKPIGGETISFGRDVAPILIESCSGCHLDTRRVRGDFSMQNFVRLLRGGESGNPFVRGAPAESNLVKRLRGIDSEVMPPRKKLPEKKIQIIEKWIAEGASFDGLLPSNEIKTIASIAKAESQTHVQLTKARDKLGVDNWKLIMDNDEPGKFGDEHFRVLGPGRSGRLEDAAAMANNLRPLIIEELQTDEQQPFVKGKPTIYLFERRYDLNELGKMLADKELPKSQTGRWDYSTVDAYVSLLISRGRTPAAIKAELAQQLAAIHVAGLARDVPRWFADGVGYQTAARILRKSKDNETKTWKTSASKVVDNMDQPNSFAIGELNEQDSGLAGYAFVDDMKRKGKLTPLMKNLKNGASFEEAFEIAYGSKPAEYFKPPRRRRGRRRR